MKAIIVYDSTDKNMIRRVLAVPKSMSLSDAVERIEKVIADNKVKSVDDVDNLIFSFDDIVFDSIDLNDMIDHSLED